MSHLQHPVHYPTISYTNPGPHYNYLYTINRMGCGPVSDHFEISRDASYRYYVLHYVYEGCGILNVDGMHYKLQVGDLFMLGPGKPHLYASEAPHHLKLLWVEFYGSNTHELMHLLLNQNVHLLHAAHALPIAQKMLELLTTIEESSKSSPFQVAEKLYGILLKTLEAGLESLQFQEEHIPLRIPEPIQKALSYIESHLYEPLKVSDVAKHVNCCPSYLSKIFSDTMGISPYKYILIKKMEYAMIRLSSSEVTASHLAEELGFVDPAHFTKAFKKVTGQSISTYRQQEVLGH